MKTLILSFIALVTSSSVIAYDMRPPVRLEHSNIRRRAKRGKGTTRVHVCHKTDDTEGCGWKDLEFDDSGLPGHLGHGDYEGTCADTLCDDQDLCTTDIFDDINCCTHDPVTCAANEICDPTIGCFDPQVVCDDDDTCTIDTWNMEAHECENDAIDCSPISPYHFCDNGSCEPNCPDDGDACTVDAWNPTLNDCYTPVVCPPGSVCDPVTGCFDVGLECDDGDMCTMEGWDPAVGCVYTSVVCPSPDQICDEALGCICDDGDLCTNDSYDSTANTCDFRPKECPTNHSCDPVDGNCKLDEELVPCVAVIDEDSAYPNTDTVADWNTFRADYPSRPFCLLIPSSTASGVYIPPLAVSDTNFQSHLVSRDNGFSPADDWFTKCGLDNLGTSNVPFIGLFVDESGSMTKDTVKNAYNKFIQDAANAGLTICEVHDMSEKWIPPFLTTLTPNSGSCDPPTPL